MIKLFKKKDTAKEEPKQIQEPMKEIKATDDKPKSVGMTTQLHEIREQLDIITNIKKGKDEKVKPFKVPWKIRRQLKKLAKKNKVLVFYLKANRTISPIITEIKDGLIRVQDKYYECDLPFMYLWEGKSPSIVLPEWSLRPIGTADYYKAVEGKETGVYAQATFIRAMKEALKEEKKKLKFSWILMILIGAAVAVYVFFFNKKA